MEPRNELLDKMNEVREGVLKLAVASVVPTVQNMARQTLDHLDAAALFFMQLVQFDAASNKAISEAMNKKGLTVTEAPANG